MTSIDLYQELIKVPNLGFRMFNLAIYLQRELLIYLESSKLISFRLFLLRPDKLYKSSGRPMGIFFVLKIDL